MTRPYHRSPLPSEASLSESVPVVSEAMAPPSAGQAHRPRSGYVVSGCVTGAHILPPEIAPIEPSTTRPAQFYVNSMKSIHIHQELDQLMTSQSILRTVLGAEQPDIHIGNVPLHRERTSSTNTDGRNPATWRKTQSWTEKYVPELG